MQSELVVTGTAGASVTAWNPQTDGRNYRATISSTEVGTAIFNVAANVAEDRAENLNTAATQQTVQVDPDLPTVRIDVPSTPQNSVFDVTVIFSEAVTGFAQAELVVSGTSDATITSWSPQTGGRTYVATITPTQSGTTIFNVAADVAQDVAQNGNTAAAEQTVQVDLIRPTVRIDAPSGAQAETFDVTVVFSEAVTGFLQSELVVTGTSGASVTAWHPQMDGRNYSATISSTEVGTAIFNVAANVAEDGATNLNTAAIQQTVQVDPDLPTVRIDVPAAPQNSLFNVTVVFNEAVTGFLQSELVVTGASGASITNWSAQTGGTNYIATITPTRSGETVFNVAADVAQDIAQNGNTVAAEQTVQVDLIPPTVIIDVPDYTLTGDFRVMVTFSEPVNGFSKQRLLMSEPTAATITNWRAYLDRQLYTATIIPVTNVESTLTFRVAANAAVDAAGNGNAASEIAEVQVDTQPPCLTLKVNQGGQTGAFDVEISFTEPVSNFEEGDLLLAGMLEARIRNWRVRNDGLDYHATIVPSPFKRTDSTVSMDSGTVTLHVAQAVAVDAAGNGNSNVDVRTVVVVFPKDSEDTQAPWAAIEVPTDTQTGAFDVTIIFTEPVNDFSVEDLSVTPSDTLIKNWGPYADRRRYTATIEPHASGPVTLNIAANVAEDDAGNGNHATTEESVTVEFPATTDTEKPTVTISGPTHNPSGPFDATIQFSEPVTGFRQNDLNLPNLCFSITHWQPDPNGQNYVVTITPTESATLTLNVPERVAQDSSGNYNTASTKTTVSVNLPETRVYIEAPTITREVFEVTVVFTDRVTGFTQEELLFTDDSTAVASITDWDAHPGRSRFTAEITPTKHGALMIAVAADAAADGNAAAAPVKALISPEDINQDGVVDDQDLSLVAKDFGEHVPNEQEKNPDVNRDSVVTLEDYALVEAQIAANSESVPASPQILQNLLEHLKQLDSSDPALRSGIQALEAHLLMRLPTKTELLPNYPNPFNPETWIPYQLASDSNVLITIYNPQGTLIRTLDLGNQSAGYYTDRSHAAYWNGCNGLGERVGSGIYFYQLRAGNVSLLRKMVILK